MKARGKWAGTGYFLLTTIVLFGVLNSWGYDDPFITYRYAENLHTGLGFVYNAGERVLSTTAPFFALILAGVRFFWANLPRAANLISAISLAAGALFLWDIATQWERPLVGWAALLLYPTFFFLVTTLGSETPLYLALCLGAIASYLRQKYTLSATLLALAILTRGDAAILALVLAADWLLHHLGSPTKPLSLKLLPWRAVIVGTAILLLWVIFAIPYFGSPLPVTLAVKRAQGLLNISESFAPGFFVIVHPNTNMISFWVETILFFIGAGFAVWRARPWLLLLIWAGLYFLAYTALGVTRYFWYYAPLVPAIVGMIGLGLEAVKECIPPARAGRRFLAWASILTLAGLAIAQGIHLFQIRDNLDPRLTAYRMVGEWLSQNTSPTVAIGTLEVGVIGYYASPRPIIDFAGLIQPEVADLFAPQITYQNTAIWAITMYKPRILVLHSGSFPYLEQTFVADNCTRAKKFPGKETGYSQDLIIYKCQYP